MCGNLGYNGPFDKQLIDDLKHPIRRAFLLASIEGVQKERNRILEAIDIFYMTFQSANMKRGYKPKSMFGKVEKKEKSFFWHTIPGKDGPRKIKVYF